MKNIENIASLISEDPDKVKSEKILHIGFDMDDVLADMDDMLRSDLKEHNINITYEDRITYYFEDNEEIAKKVDIPVNELHDVAQHVFDTMDWENLKPVKSAVKAFKDLQNKGHKMYIITARSESPESHLWLEKHGIAAEEVIFCRKKGDPARAQEKGDIKAEKAKKLNLDYFIDDGTHNLEPMKGKCIPIAYTHPWNKDWAGHRTTGPEIVNFIEKLEDQ